MNEKENGISAQVLAYITAGLLAVGGIVSIVLSFSNKMDADQTGKLIDLKDAPVMQMMDATKQDLQELKSDVKDLTHYLKGE